MIGIILTLTACAAPEPPLSAQLGSSATVLRTVDPAAPLDDLGVLARAVGDAQVVGLGESVHGAAEELRLKHRVLRLLVERRGFRSVAWEEDWTTGLDIDEYLRTGAGDPTALVRRMSPQWQAREVADVLRWLRAFNIGRTDPVRFVGVEYYLTGRRAYDEVDGYVARTAPARLPELRAHLQALRPSTTDVFAHIGWYTGVADKEPYLRHARQVVELVDGLPHPPADRDHALGAHAAHQIAAFYGHFAMPKADAEVFRDTRAAENLRWWRDLTGTKVAYWAASPHTANAPAMRIAAPPDPDLRFASAGSYLRHWYGAQYRSFGFTVGSGTVGLGGGQTVTLPEPADDWFERPLTEVGPDQFVIDLADVPPSASGWMNGPVRTRGLADRGPGSVTDGGSLHEWFDVIVHRQRATPASPP